MATLTLTFDSKNTIEKLAMVLGNKTGAFNDILRDLGVTVLGWTEQGFEQQGKRFGGWVKMSVVTLLMRASGRGTVRVSNWSQASAIANTMPVLQDSGKLRSSFSQGDPNNKMELGKMSIRVGSSLPYAITMNDGGVIQKTFTAEQQARFWQRVDPGMPGAWNSWVFQMWNALRRDAGLTQVAPKSTEAKVPARPIIIASFSEEEQEDLRAVTQEGLDHLIHALGLDRPGTGLQP